MTFNVGSRIAQGAMSGDEALRPETADPNMSLSPTISLTAAAVVT
ncbi:MAG: hypothetical protein OSB03_13020 [Vicinamibacterales bacterium]|jgi:hypothetical protein|nr:hypothetical protein [Vicinamibacterales bacterium]